MQHPQSWHNKRPHVLLHQSMLVWPRQSIRDKYTLASPCLASQTRYSGVIGRAALRGSLCVSVTYFSMYLFLCSSDSAINDYCVFCLSWYQAGDQLITWLPSTPAGTWGVARPALNSSSTWTRTLPHRSPPLQFRAGWQNLPTKKTEILLTRQQFFFPITIELYAQLRTTVVATFPCLLCPQSTLLDINRHCRQHEFSEHHWVLPIPE